MNWIVAHIEIFAAWPTVVIGVLAAVAGALAAFGVNRLLRTDP